MTTLSPKDTSFEQIQNVLNSIASAIAADAIFVYEINHESNRLEVSAIKSVNFDISRLSMEAQTLLGRMVRDAVNAILTKAPLNPPAGTGFAAAASSQRITDERQRVKDSELSGAQITPMVALEAMAESAAKKQTLLNAQAFSPSALDRTPFKGGVLVPLQGADRLYGALAIYSLTPGESFTRLIDKINFQISYLSSLVENRYLRTLVAENVAAAGAIVEIAQAVAESPSPQEIIDILRKTLFGAHISSAAMLLYGSVQEDQPDAPFEYLELAGTWSRRVGSGVGMGLRFYLKDYPKEIEQLDRDRVLTYRHFENARDDFDPLIRSLLRAERIRSATFLTLQSAQRKLGVLFIATDKPYDFPPREIHSYRTVSEFMAMSSTAQLLQQQHDRVQQGRAALLDAVTDGVVMVLPRGRGGSVLTVNTRFTSMFDVNEADAQQLSLIELLDKMQLPEDTRKGLRRAWLGIPVRDPNTHEGEFSLIDQDGRPMDIEWYSAPVYQGETVLGRIYLFHDVTAERTATRLRAMFLSRVSHELRTPLTSIQGFAEFILEITGDQLPPLALEYTQIILNSSKHLTRVFSDIIEITRADAGELKLTKEVSFLSDIVIDVVSRMEPQLKKRNQTLVMDLDDELPAVNVDMDRIIQVLTNLITNAIKYSSENGDIIIKTELIDEGNIPDGSPPDLTLPAVLTTIQDQGQGLTEENTEKVFLPFFRTENVKREKIEGVGLGLSVTRSLVEMHRGKIWAIPREIANGGCFRFTIPIVRG